MSACGWCGEELVPGVAEEAEHWRTAGAGRYFCTGSPDGLHHPAAPDGLRFGVIVSVAAITATPGAPLLAGYWLRHRPGEGVDEWRKREDRERRLRRARRSLAQLGGVGGASPDCPLCAGSGIVWGDDLALAYCPNNNPSTTPRGEATNHGT